jgi:nitrogen fixation/metabolism regulation signal transduction histidine kinase
MRQIELVLLASVAVILICGGAFYLAERRRRELRLARLERALDSLSQGDTGIVLGEQRRDIIGRIAAAVEKSSRLAAQSRKRLQYLEHLSSWQEAARRHAHEIRTPLTAARMEVDRLVAVAARVAPEAALEVAEARVSIIEELDRLRAFTKNFTSVAMIGKPHRQRFDLSKLVGDFCGNFAAAWPDLRLAAHSSNDSDAVVNADSEMLRQVLVNLCNNSALAGAQSVVFTARRDRDNVLLDVIDDGPGVPTEVEGRLFEPYTTTRGIGEGMGLGLAISKKILLDHGGDLEHVRTARGAAFRLIFPAERVS